MQNDNSKGDASEIVRAGSHGLAQRSAALVRRGLVGLSTADMARVIEAGKALTSSLSSGDELTMLIAKFSEVFPQYPSWSLLLMDAENEELYLWISGGKEMHSLSPGAIPAVWKFNSEEANALRRLRIKPGEGIAGWVAQNCESVMLPNAREDSRFSAGVDVCLETEVQSIVGVPLRVEDRSLGVIELINCMGSGEFSQTELSLLQTFADFAAIAVENQRYLWARTKAHITDERTGLHNSRNLELVLEMEIYRSQRYGYEFSVLRIDLIGLKDLMKTVSYLYFSHLLIELGNAFQKELRLIDSGSYYGDGEFMVVLPQQDKEGGRLIARRLHKLFSEASWLRVVGQSARLPARIGAATFPEDGKTKADLLHSLDEAIDLLKKSSTDGGVAVRAEILSSL